VILAQISDPHVELGPGDRGSAESLAAGVRAVLALRPLPDAVLVSGDLAEHAADAEYERVRELLAPLPMPVHVLPGNHDDRDTLRAHFPVDGAGPYRYAVDVGGVRLGACDSTIPGRAEGVVDAGWLETQLGDGPAIVAMHHPAFAVGMPGLDVGGLLPTDHAALTSLLERSPQVRRVIGGHVHRAAFATVGGRPAMTCPSIHLSARLEIGAPGFELVPEPPALAVHVAVGDEIVTHIQPVATPHRA
jgi:Icc protein